MPVSLVVATRDRADLLRGMLAAVSEDLRSGDEVIVVDSASRSAQTRKVALLAGADYVRCELPGTCRARNAGWRASRNSHVLFTDDDCRPTKGWSSALSHALERPEKPAFVTGQVLDDPAGVDREAPDLLDTEHGRGRGRGGRRRGGGRGRATMKLSLTDSVTPTWFSDGDPVDLMGHGANMAWRRDALEDIGGFDESLGPGATFAAGEDKDAFWRALRKGHRGLFDPGAVVLHPQWRTRWESIRTYYGYGVGSGALAVKISRLDAFARGRSASRAAATSVGGAARLLWEEGSPGVTAALRKRYVTGTVAEMAKAAGIARGIVGARSLRIEDGHFVAPLRP
jgi:glycosyltransferase involved in cell wall biosynthesis